MKKILLLLIASATIFSICTTETSDRQQRKRKKHVKQPYGSQSNFDSEAISTILVINLLKQGHLDTFLPAITKNLIENPEEIRTSLELDDGQYQEMLRYCLAKTSRRRGK